jgi:hypothetical protein
MQAFVCKNTSSYDKFVVGTKLSKELTIKNPRVKYNVNFLEDSTTKDQFNITLSSKFQILEELDNKGASVCVQKYFLL